MTTKLSNWTRAGRTVGALCVGVLWATPTDVLGQGTLSGNVSGSAATFTGALAGEVTGPQGATVVSPSIARDTEIVPALLAADGAGSGVDADLLDGLNSSAFAQTGANTFTATQTINTGNLDLDASTATTGNLLKDGTPFLHNFGTDNTFLGAQAGNFTMTGFSNTASGRQALTANATGFLNTASGANALGSNTTGFSNTASGVGALGNNTTGSSNTAVGLSAGSDATTGSNNIYLGANVVGVAGESNAMYLGLQGTQTKTVIAGIRGTTTGIADAIPVMIDSAGQLGTAGASSGVATLGTNTFTATQTINTGNLDLDNSTATTGNLTKGGTRFLHNFGTNNTFLGDRAGNFTMTGGSNTASGLLALNANTTGNFNTASGSRALIANTTGFSNTASGDRALTANTTGNSNAASGVSALLSNTTGSDNTASGHGALNDNTTGGNNTAVGTSAGSNATTGSNNIYLGASVVGVAGESNTMYLGLQGTQTMTVIAGIRGITIGVANAIPVLIDSNGQVGTVSSSRRYKEDIEEMAGASSSVLSLRPVTFRYRQAFNDGSKPIQYGLIAEEVADVFPDLVVYNEDGEPETVKYHLLATMLVNELQKQQREFQKQQREFQKQQREFQALQQVTADQAAQLVSLERQNHAHERERERLAAVEATLVELTALTAGLARSAAQDRSVEVASR